jgi:uncharacterized membrane protein
MPYHWTEPTAEAPASLTLWPHRSLPRRGFAGVIAVTALLLALPLSTQLGTPGLWVLLPFLLSALAGLWIALQQTYSSGQVVEVLTLTPDHLTLTQSRPGQPDKTWDDNPYWTRTRLHPTGGPVPQYLTLKGTAREVELGAFLSEAERLALKAELDDALAALHHPGI